MNTTTRSRTAALLAAALLTLGLSACKSTDEPAAATSGGPGAGTANVSAAGYPGLYYDASLVTVVPAEADQLKLVGTMTCAKMDAMLSAGQWRVVDRLALPSGSAGAAIAGIVPGLLLERAGTLAFATLKGDRDLCTATVSKAQSDGIAVTGKGYPGPAAGWSATSMCVKLDAETLNVSLYFDTQAKLGGMVTVTLKGKDGKYAVDGESSDFNVQLLTHQSSVLATYSKVFGDAKELPGVAVHSLEPGDAFTGTAAVDAGTADRPRGSFSVTGLVDSETEGEVSLSLPFGCPNVQVFAAA